MSVWPFIGGMIGAALAPLIKLATARLRCSIRHRMNDGPLRRILLTPIGYTKKARDEAATEALLDDYHLLRPHQLRERDSARPAALPAKRL